MRIIVGFIKIYKKYVLQNDRESMRLYEEVIEFISKLRPEGHTLECTWDILDELLAE